MQRQLSSDQVREFYHDNFVADQVRDFLALVGPAPAEGAGAGAIVADIGGGCGFFARALQGRSGWRARVLDMDPVSVRTCQQHDVQARVADALKPEIAGDESVVSFNLMLHHLVGKTAAQTRALQLQALRAWALQAPRVFVNEYIYESFGVRSASGWLIYAVTSSQALSWLAQAVARVVPSLRANTFGVGVRFRGADEWIALFREAGYDLVASRRGHEERVSLARRLLLIRSCRRDSFLLRATSAPSP